MAEKIARIVYENTVPAVFVKRYNRFSAGVLIDGKEETVHVKNTGRLGELLVPGAAVTLQKAENPARKTAYDLISVYKQGLEWVNIDSLAPNALMKQYLENLRSYDLVKPEYTGIPDSIFIWREGRRNICGRSKDARWQKDRILPSGFSRTLLQNGA